LDYFFGFLFNAWLQFGVKLDFEKLADEPETMTQVKVLVGFLTEELNNAQTTTHGADPASLR